MGEYVRPTKLNDLFVALAQRDWRILAGGTDYFPAKVGRSLDDDILDITNVSELRGISHNGNGWQIGAATCWSDILAAKLPPMFDGLKAAAKEIGGRQIQNAGTIGGNICNASPAADGVPVLLSLGASVEIASDKSTECMPLDVFITGNRRTKLHANEVLTKIIIPNVPAENTASHFLKLGSREYLVISLVMVAGVLGWDKQGMITHCKISVGACSEVAKRLLRLEALLIGQRLQKGLSMLITDEVFSDLTPIDDVRASAEYRRKAGQKLVGVLLEHWGANNA